MIALFGLAACDKAEKAPEKPGVPAEAAANETPAAPATPGTPTEKPVTPPPVEKPAIPALAPEQRAAVLGFARYLPKNADMVLSYQNGKDTATRLKGTQLWKLISSELGMSPEPAANDEFAEDAEAEAGEDAAPEPIGPAMLFEKEFTLALLQPTSEQLGLFSKANARVAYFQAEVWGAAIMNAIKAGSSADLSNIMNASPFEPYTKLLKDPASGMALIDQLQMPPILISFKVEEAKKQEVLQFITGPIAGMTMMAGDMIEPVTLETAGQSFQGYKMLGAKLSEQMSQGRAEMDASLGAETTDALIASIAKKDLLLATGTIGDYVVIYLGGTAEGLNLTTDVATSLAASDELAFIDAYEKKPLAAWLYAEKDLSVQAIENAAGLYTYLQGLVTGITSVEGISDSRDLLELVQIFEDREKALSALATYDWSGMAAYFEEGLKIDFHGNSDIGMIDYKTKNQMAKLGDAEDVLLFMNYSTLTEYDQKSSEMLEALVHTAYELATKIAEVPSEMPEMMQFKNMTQLFDTQFRTDAIALWQAYSDNFGAGLGQESALVIDLNGSVPAVPGLPQALIDEGKVPRISLISPVTDRAKISASWTQMNETTTSMLGKISQMVGQDIPMQKPLSSEKDAFTTWFFPLPFFNDDFLPSVTLSDQWFAASTSKNRAVDLLGKAAAAEPVEASGFHFSMNMVLLQTYADECLELYRKHAEAMTGQPVDEEMLAETKSWIEATRDLQSIKAHSYVEDGKGMLRIHFKTK